jgi:hypothetical protein
MAVPPKSMKQGIYWVQKHLKHQNQSGIRLQTINANPLDVDYNNLRDQCKKLEKQWLTLLDNVQLSTEDADAVDKNIFNLRDKSREYGLVPVISIGDLEDFTAAFLNAAINLIFACFKYDLKRPRNKTITWSKEDLTLYISGKPYMNLKHGGNIKSIAFDAQPLKTK